MSYPSFSRTLGELGAGSLESQATLALRNIAKAVHAYDANKTKGALRIDLKIERARGTGQLLVTSRLAYTQPTGAGKLSEETNEETLMYLNADGSLSVVPAAQATFDFSPAKETAP
jgi:hypothetical protein